MTNHPFSQSPFMTVEEVAAYLRVQTSTVYGWKYRGLIGARKHGARLLFHRDEVERFSSANRVDPLPPIYVNFRATSSSPAQGARDGSLKTKRAAGKEP